MTLSDEVKILRDIPAFAQVDAKTLKLLAFSSSEAIFGEGEVLMRAGEMGETAFLLLEGRVEVSRPGEDGEVQLAEIAAHDLVGEISILCDLPRTATVRALTPVKALIIEKGTFERLVRESPTMAMAFMRMIARRYDDTVKQLFEARARAHPGFDVDR